MVDDEVVGWVEAGSLGTWLSLSSARWDGT
jgi:hypothetical protein